MQCTFQRFVCNLRNIVEKGNRNSMLVVPLKSRFVNVQQFCSHRHVLQMPSILQNLEMFLQHQSKSFPTRLNYKKAFFLYKDCHNILLVKHFHESYSIFYDQKWQQRFLQNLFKLIQCWGTSVHIYFCAAHMHLSPFWIGLAQNT